MRCLFFLLLLLSIHQINGQVVDDFSDGDFTSNPTWSGDDVEFRVNAGELQLFGVGTDDSHLMTTSTLVEEATWEFFFRWEDFASTGLSGSNEVFFYLVADQNAPPETNDIAGYFVRIGNTQDEISLYRQDTDLGSVVELVDGNANGFGGVTEFSNGSIRVQVTRDDTGTWILSADLSGGSSFSEIGSAVDDTHSTSSFAGIFIDYSSGNADGYFFDDISIVSTAGPDEDPPAIEIVTAISDTQVDVDFDEMVDLTTSQNHFNYSLTGSITVLNAERDDSDFSIVHLTVSPLTNGDTYSLSVNNVEDEIGNAMIDPIQGTFRYLMTEEAEELDVVINEFMADPNPVIADLPDAEYVELHNRSDKFFQLENWTLDGQILPNHILEPNDFVLVIDDNDESLFDSFSNVISISSLSLSNSSLDNITLQDFNADTIHSIAFEGSVGGISTELINPFDPCLSPSSYINSTDASGGTPGQENSVFDDSADETRPTIVSSEFTSTLTIEFSEEMDASSLLEGSYEVDNLTIDQIITEGEFPTEIVISFMEPIVAGTIYNLTIAEVLDCAGNSIEPSSVVFGFGRSPKFNELIITELMFDESPAVGLPEREYIEIYNATNDLIALEGVQLMDATSTVNLPTLTLSPQSYYLLTSPAAVPEFSANAIGVAGFPSLNNSGEQLLLVRDDKLLFSLSYDPNWHESSKQEGGFSLELLDVNNPCAEDNNWASSLYPNGGTPGIKNSQTRDLPDNFGPNVIAVIALSEDTVRIDFDEKIHPDSPMSVMVGFQPETIIQQYFFDKTRPNSLFVILNEPLVVSVPTSIDILKVFDCNGNEVQNTEIVFALPERANNGDVLLSEVLFNPRTNGVDFVEIYNNSEKYLSLTDWKLARTTENGVSDIKSIATEELVIDPQEYLVFTEDADLLLSNYPKGQAEQFIEVASLPTYANDTGNVILLNDSSLIQERLFYDEDFHYDLLEDVDGISLERVSFSAETNDPNNWRSASSMEGFATPGYANSQSFEGEAPIGSITIKPKVFIPGNTGLGRDFTTINYQFDHPGKFANVTIYDQNGRLVRDLVEGALLSTSGFLRWDGVTNNGGMARLGYYLVIFEVYDVTGSTQTLKETVVVGRDF